MEEQRWVKTNVAKLGGALQGSSSLEEFGSRLLSGLVPMLGGGVGALYALEEDDRHQLRRVAGYGLGAAAHSAERLRIGEGLVGQCAKDRMPAVLTDLPPDYLRISSLVGESVPLQTVAWPIVPRDELLGVLEFASFRQFSATEKALIEELLPLVAMSLEILLRNLATQSLLKQTQEQAHQLEEQAAAAELRSRLDAMHSEISAALVQVQDFGAAMQACAGALVRGVGTAFARTWIVEPDTDELVLAASAGLYTHLDGGHARVKVGGETKLARIASSRRPLETNSFASEPGVDAAWAREQGLSPSPAIRCWCRTG